MTSNNLTEKQRTVLLLKQMQAKIDAAERKHREPIAVVGIGCRFPGGDQDANSAEAFWEILASGTDAISEVPSERWDVDAYYASDPNQAGKMNTRFGGFLRGVERFDAEFFGISPREAVSMDPQQRLVLERAWRALEHAGIPPNDLNGSRSGVFLGICSNDYARMGDGLGGCGSLDTYSGTGGACGVAAGRLSYYLGLQGPSMVVDTACSSSLVATHLAVQSLRLGECDLALAGGVNLVLLPDGTVTLSRLHMMAPDGRCKAFDASANGFVRGEGCGIVVLKRLSDAKVDGSRILAVIHGTAVNQDGRSSGLTAPNGLAQEAVLKDALANAGITASDVSLIEAHGTGTALGDPIEMNALSSVMGSGRVRPLWVGSVKTNIGHLEAAAGIAGLVKAIECVRRGKIPPSLHFKQLNPEIEAQGCPLTIPVHSTTFTDNAPRIAGISSFGFSGTNAHVIIAAPTDSSMPDHPVSGIDSVITAPASNKRFEILPLSACNENALHELVNDVSQSAALEQWELASYTSAVGRSHHQHRVAVTADNEQDFRQRLSEANHHVAGRPKIAFLFTGQGAQFRGMGKQLFETEPVFRDELKHYAEVLDPILGCSLTALMFNGEPDLNLTRYCQPALLAFELALTSLWKSWGVNPIAVMGHSLGEYSAAVVAGAIAKDDALKLVARRGELMASLPKGGAMAAVRISAAQLTPFLNREPELSLAAENGPRASTIAGPKSALERILLVLEREGIVSHPLSVSHAFHSSLIEPMLDHLEEAASAITYQTPNIPVVGNVKAEVLNTFNGAYWRLHSRSPVMFAAGMRQLQTLGCNVFIEIGPKPLLMSLGKACVEGGNWLASSNETASPNRIVYESLARLYELGGEIDWRGVHADRTRSFICFPGHPFQRRKYWRSGGKAVVEGTTRKHPLLTERIDLSEGRSVFRSRLPNPQLAWLNEHQVNGSIIAPAALMLEACTAAIQECNLGTKLVDIEFPASLILSGEPEFQIEVSPDRIAFSSRKTDDGASWTVHLTAGLAAKRISFETVEPESCPNSVDPNELYRWLEEGGLAYGATFRRIKSACRGDGVAIIQLSDIERQSHTIHPALIDVALQAMAVVTFGGEGDMRIPVFMQAFSLERDVDHGKELFAEVRLTGTAKSLSADVRLRDESHHTIATAAGIRLSTPKNSEDWQRWLLQPLWREKARVPNPAQIAKEVGDKCRNAMTAPKRGGLQGLGAQLDSAAIGFAQRAIRDLNRQDIVERHSLLYKRLENSTKDVAYIDPTETLQRLRNEHPEGITEIELLARCGIRLADVLTGQQDPLQLVFSDESQRNVYRDSPVSKLLNALVEEAVLRSLPSEGPIHLLEVGAGTGGTTDGILERLPADRISEYMFTDIADSLLAHAKSKYREKLFVQTRRLDLDVEPDSQGFELGRYHVIIAANVIHATCDLTATLARLDQLLAKGGRLILLEGAGSQGWVDLVFGLTEGWWRFTDHELRADYPLLEREEWLKLLQTTGWDPAEVPTQGEWLERQVVIVAGKRAAQRILVAGHTDSLTNSLVTKLRERGTSCTLIDPTEPIPPGTWDTCIYTGALVTDSAPVELKQLWRDQRRVLSDAHQLALNISDRGSRLVIVTQGARGANPSHAALWGLARGIAMELPDLNTLRLDLALSAQPPETAGWIADEILFGDCEDQVALEPDKRLVARLSRLWDESAPHPQLEDASVYLITGGFGGLGLVSAEWLIARGAKHLVLMGRSEPSDAAEEKIAAMKATGANISCVVGDVSREADIRSALAVAGPHLSGVIHAAGTLDDGVLANLNWERMERVLAAKLAGAWLLDKWTENLDFLIFYSSAVGLVGTKGQANHLAANAYLDALAEARNQRGESTISLAWGAWSEIGSATSPEIAQKLRNSGMNTINPNQGVRVLDWALNAPCANVGVLPIDFPVFAKQFDGNVPPLLCELIGVHNHEVIDQQADEIPQVHRLPARQPARTILQQVIHEAATVLAVANQDSLDPQRNLFELGMDSLMAVELRNRLQKNLNVSLPSTLLFDHSSAAAIAKYLDDQPTELTDSPHRNSTKLIDEPIAVIGMDCRFPGGASSPNQFWQLLCDGFDGVGEYPSNRWNGKAARDQDTTRWGAFLEQVDQFDAAFFRIAPREAVSMDPQQRLLLEVAWHALERSGISFDQLSGSETGIFMGLCNYDYSQITSANAPIDAWSATGGAPSIVAGRLAYFLGTEGPAMVIDTACSSSLVSLHQACQSLRQGDCDLALAGGVNLILAPDSTIALSELNMMAPDGRCKVFDSRGDGFVRGEGCGVLVLKRLSEAIADRNPLLAVIRGSHVNQDGHSSSLTAPNGRSQESVVRRALQAANIEPQRVGYVEAHGTGTALGDPIEFHALKAVFAPHRSAENPLVVGAVKSNIGHLEAAAGIAGLIKSVLAVQHGVAPPNLHFRTLNPHISHHDFPYLLPQETTTWGNSDDSRIAGVSSFGFSGTNAHVVLEQAPTSPELDERSPRDAELLTLSAASLTAAKSLAESYADLLDEPNPVDLGNLAHTARTTRAHLTHRIAVVGSNAQHAAQELRQQRPSPTPPQPPKIGFVFPGQGTQFPGMGKHYYENEAVFRKAIDRVCSILRHDLDRPLTDVMFGGDKLIHETVYTQPSLFAVEFALTSLWRSWGVEPDAVIGSGFGEYTAAAVAGAVSLEDAARLVAARGRLMQTLPQQGAMAVASVSTETAEKALQGRQDRLSIASVNGPAEVVLSGDREILTRVLEEMKIPTQADHFLPVSTAFHSPLIEPILDELENLVSTISWQASERPFYSGHTGLQVHTFNAAYWRNHARHAVRLADGLDSMANIGSMTFLEVGPQSTLSRIISSFRDDVTYLPSMDPASNSQNTLLNSLGQLYLAGLPIKWDSFDQNRNYEIIPAPAYPFERSRFWVKADPTTVPRIPPSPQHLTGTRLRGPGKVFRYESSISTEQFVWLKDHQIQNAPVLPGAAMVEILLGTEPSGQAVTIKDMQFKRLLSVDSGQLLQTERDDDDAVIYASPQTHDDWKTTATAKVSSQSPSISPRENLEQIRQRCSQLVDVDRFYDGFASQQLVYGKSFQCIKDLQHGNGEALARIQLAKDLDLDGVQIHPILLDGAFQTLGAAARDLNLSHRGYLPTRLGRFVYHGSKPSSQCFVWSSIKQDDHGDLSGEVRLLTADGLEIARAENLVLTPSVMPSVLAPAVFDVEWRKVDTADTFAGRIHIVPDESTVAQDLSDFLGRQDSACVPVAHEDEAETIISLAGVAPTSPQSAAERLLELVKRLILLPKPPRLCVITRDTAVLDQQSDCPDVAAATLWGFVASLGKEHPELEPTIIDLPSEKTIPDAFLIALRENGPVLAVRPNGLWRRDMAIRSPRHTSVPFALKPPADGRLGELGFAPLKRRKPEPREVEISVVASGINFRDLMNALGTYPGDAGELGGECAGYVNAIGSDVENLKVGQPVMAIAPGCHASHVIAKSALVLPKPDILSFEQAATLPTVLLTAAWSLRRIGKITEGQKVLIHAAAGGLGMAAFQIAKSAGAEVLATAGSEKKREYLRQLGAALVSDSRSNVFHNEIQDWNQGEGVDLVLNSLSGDMIPASFDLLRPGGRFLEVGKANIWDDLKAQQYRPDVEYHRIALDENLYTDPEKIGAYWRELMTEITTGRLAPLPVQTFSMHEVEPAFRFMQQAQHIGRIALSRRCLRDDSAYLVTGGTGGLGMHVARWLAARGAGEIVLMARNEPRSEVEAKLNMLRAMGTPFRVVQGDVSQSADVDRVLSSLQRPLAGVVHTAGVLDDGVISEQTPARFHNVLSAKVSGAVILDRATRTMPIDLFVLFSSAAGILGSPGQTNYAAANSALDAIAYERRSQGLPALTVNWGAWAGDGMAANWQGNSLEPDDALRVLDQLLTEDSTQAMVLASEQQRQPESANQKPCLYAELAKQPFGQRLQTLKKTVREEAASILGVSQETIESNRPLHDYGLDSLMAVELRKSLSTMFGHPLPSSLLFDYPHIEAISQFISDTFEPHASNKSTSTLSKSAEEKPLERESSITDAPQKDKPSNEELNRALMEELDDAGY